jgi:two-component system, chemotaxis family, protein-glutamate methylesterase/glutaminase
MIPGAAMLTRDIILIGASAGGVEGLTAAVRGLPRDLPAAVFVVLHVPPLGDSALPSLLELAGSLPAEHARDGEPIQQGRIYVAPPDHHMLVRKGEVRLGRGPAENGHRPAVDPLFRSAALAYGARCLGVVLSGALDDGTAGLLAVKSRGGLAVVQDPQEALYPSMPRSALKHVAVDHVVSAKELGTLLNRLVLEPLEHVHDAGAGTPEGAGLEVRVAAHDLHAASDLVERTAPSVFACPDCRGVLWEMREGELLRYRCRVGHAYLPQSLAAAQSERLEEALWSALRALREAAALSARLSERSSERGLAHLASEYTSRALEVEERAKLIENVLRRGRLSTVGDTTDAPSETQSDTKSQG